MAYTRIIENLTLTSTLRLEGAQWNDTLVRNVTITGAEGDGIFLRNVSNIRIENVTITGVTGTGIRLSSTGATSGVEIVGNTITGTGRDGIFAGESDGIGHPGLRIAGNMVSDTGQAAPGSGLLHGIYVQSPDFEISGNTVLDSLGGNGISVRSAGLVQGNHIDGAWKSGVAYYADHPSGGGGGLVIAGNVVSDAGRDGWRGAVNLLDLPEGADAVGSVTLRDNIVTGPKGVVIDAGIGAGGIGVDVSGNVTVDADAARALMSQAPDIATATPELAPARAGFVLSPGAGTRTEVDLFLNGWVSEIDSPRQKLATVDLDEIGLRISAMHGDQTASVGIDGGHIGVMTEGEAIFDASRILGDEVLIFDFTDGPGQVVDVTLDLLGAGTAVLTGHRDGIGIGSRVLSGENVTFADDLGIDRLVLSAGSGGVGIAVTGLDAVWTYQDGGLL